MIPRTIAFSKGGLVGGLVCLIKFAVFTNGWVVVELIDFQVGNATLLLAI